MDVNIQRSRSNDISVFSYIFRNMKSVIKKSVTIKDKKTEDLEQQIVDQEDRHKRRRLTLLRGKYQRGMKMLYNQSVEIEKL